MYCFVALAVMFGVVDAIVLGVMMDHVLRVLRFVVWCLVC